MTNAFWLFSENTKNLFSNTEVLGRVGELAKAIVNI